MQYGEEQDDPIDGKPQPEDDQGDNPDAEGPFGPTQPVELSGDEIGQEAEAIQGELEGLPDENPEDPGDSSGDQPESEPNEPIEGTRGVGIDDPGIPPAGGEPPPIEELTSESSWEPDMGEIDETQDSMDEFGNDLNEFNAMSGGGGDPELPEEEFDGNAKQIETDIGHRRLTNDMLTDHSRQVQDLTRALELERL